MFSSEMKRSDVRELMISRRADRSARPTRFDELLHNQITGDTVVAVWARDPQEVAELPRFLMTSDGKAYELLAWLTTFAPAVRPLTAFCRVLEKSDLVRLNRSLAPPDLGEGLNAAIGLLLGEVLSEEWVLTRTQEPLSVAACESTLSFALVREMAIHTDGGDLASVAERWLRIRALTKQRERTLKSSHVIQVAATLRALIKGGRGQPGGVDPMILEACTSMLLSEDVSSALRAWPEVRSTLSDTAPIRRRQIEERVTILENVVRQLSGHHNMSLEQQSFIVGSVASSLGSGSLAHSGLVAPLLDRWPSAMLWYGMCAGLHREPSIASEMGGIGRRALRDLLGEETLLSRPRVDVSSLELEILLGGDRQFDDFATTSLYQLTVELTPGVWTVTKWPLRPRPVAGGAIQPPTTGLETMAERSKLLHEFNVTMARLRDLVERLAKQPPALPSDQNALFDLDPPKKRKRRH
jgi:hypothetical protein